MFEHPCFGGQRITLVALIPFNTMVLRPRLASAAKSVGIYGKRNSIRGRKRTCRRKMDGMKRLRLSAEGDICGFSADFILTFGAIARSTNFNRHVWNSNSPEGRRLVLKRPENANSRNAHFNFSFHTFHGPPSDPNLSVVAFIYPRHSSCARSLAPCRSRSARRAVLLLKKLSSPPPTSL